MEKKAKKNENFYLALYCAFLIFSKIAKKHKKSTKN